MLHALTLFPLPSKGWSKQIWSLAVSTHKGRRCSATYSQQPRGREFPDANIKKAEKVAGKGRGMWEREEQMAAAADGDMAKVPNQGFWGVGIPQQLLFLPLPTEEWELGKICL